MAKKTKEQLQAEQDGNAFIRQREKLASQLTAAGSSPAGAKRKAAEQISRATEANDPLQQERDKLDQKKAAQVIQLEQQQNAQSQLKQLPTEANASVQPSVQLGTNPEDTAVNLGLNAASIAGGVAGGAGLGAAGGAALGSVVPVLGTAIGAGAGAVIGGVVGGIGTVSAKIAADRRQATKEAFTVYKSAKNRDTELINLANSGAYSADEIQLEYEKNLANLRASEAELKRQTRGAIDKALSGAMDEYIQVEAYLDKETERRQRLNLAILAPNPSVVYAVSPDSTDVNP